jgi:hypothetical protein
MFFIFSIPPKQTNPRSESPLYSPSLPLFPSVQKSKMNFLKRPFFVFIYPMLRGGQSFGRLLAGRSRRDRRRLPRGARGGLGETALPKRAAAQHQRARGKTPALHPARGAR